MNLSKERKKERRMKKKIILSSFLTIALCFSLLAGATFALFTSEDKVDIAITSGKVEGVAEITNIQTFSMDVEQESGKFELGGIVKIEKNNLMLQNIAPGDKVTFNVEVTNNSTIDALYRLLWNTTSDGQVLMSVMNVKINGTEYTGLKSYTSQWASIKKETGIDPIKVEIELPLTVGNEYQGLSTGLTLSVQMVQGNAGYNDAESYTLIKTLTADKTILDLINEGAGSILLPQGQYTLPNTVSNKTVEFVGNGNTVIDATADITLNDADITLTNVTVKGSTENYVGYKHTKKVVYNDCVINDGLFLYASEVEFNNCEFNLTTQYVWTYGADKVSFNNCVFYTTGKAVLVYNEGGADTVANFKDCEFYASKEGYTGDNQHVSAIELDARFANMTVNLEGNMIVGSKFNGLARIKDNAATGTHKQTGEPTSAIINNNATVSKADIVTNNEDLSSTINSTDTVINVVLGNSEYTLPTNKGKDLTITGSEGTTLNVAGSSAENSNVVIKNCAVVGNKDTTTWYVYNCLNAESVVYENCVITGNITTYAKKTTFKNCVFETTGDVYSVFCYSGSEVTFDGCTFDNEYGRAIKVYDEGYGQPRLVTVTNCSFSADSSNKAAVEIDSSLCKQYTVKISNCTLGDNFSKVWNAETGEDINLVVEVDGVIEHNK